MNWGDRCNGSHVVPDRKAILAAKTLLSLRDGTMDLTQAGVSLREQLGVGWSALSAAQYLTADGVMLALAELPEAWREDGLTRKDLVVALLFATYYCATANPKGAAQAQSALVRAFQVNGEMGSVLRDLLLPPRSPSQ